MALGDGPPADAGRGAGRGADRHLARERALSLLYEADVKGEKPSVVLSALAVEPDQFAFELVDGVAAHAGRIDELVSSASLGWELDRMPVLDRTILRIAVYELLERSETPIAVIIDEAVELANEYSTEQSGGFVNGVLTTVAKWVRSDAPGS
jgi:transcription antitermination protein NusB